MDRQLKVATYSLCSISVVIIGSLLIRDPIRLSLLSITASLIGLASMSTLKRRPIPLYVAFGILTAVAFWLTIDALRTQDYLGLLPTVLIVVGVAWLLRARTLPSVLFTVIAIVLMLLIVFAAYRNRFENDYLTPEQVALVAMEVSTLLVLGLLQGVVGYLSCRNQPKARKKKAAAREIATPSGATDS